MRIKTASVFIVMLIMAIPGFSQQGSGNVDEIVATPEVMSIVLLHRKLDAGEDPAGLRTFKKDDKFFFRLQMTNTSISRVVVSIIDPYYQNRPQLFRDGQLVPYRKQTAELIKHREKEPSQRHRGVIRLEPNETKEVVYIDLATWYDQLEPGHYQLSAKYRFEPGQDWVESSVVTFEVEPSK